MTCGCRGSLHRRLSPCCISQCSPRAVQNLSSAPAKSGSSRVRATWPLLPPAGSRAPSWHWADEPSRSGCSIAERA
jgi:hypothetical protein